MHFNPRLTKEIRPLVVPWLLVAAALFALGPFRRPTYDFTMMRWFIWVGGSAFLAARIFATEFEHRTVTLWLSQPVRRFEMWGDKFIVLLPAVAMLAAIALIHPDWTPNYSREKLLLFGFVSLGASIALAPFWASLARSTIGTVVFVLATQFIGTVLVLAAREWIFPSGSNLQSAKSIFTWLPYFAGTIGFFYWGWRRFARMEAIDGLPTMGVAHVTTESSSIVSGARSLLRPRPHGAWRNLVRKELHLHRPNLLLATVFVTTVLAVGLLDATSSSPTVRGVIEILRIFPFVVYGFAMTLFAGSIAFCEEKFLGTHAWSLAQPSSVRAQFLIKFGTSFSVFVVLGLLLPFTALILYPGALPDTVTLRMSSTAPRVMIPMYQLSVALCAGFILSFWSASLAPNVVRAGLTLLGVGIATALVLGNFLNQLPYLEPFPIDYSGWMASLANESIRVSHYDIKNVVLLGVSLAVLLVVYLILAAYSNFRRLAISSSRTGGQILVFFVLFCGSIFGFALVVAQPNRIGYGEYRLTIEVIEAVKRLDANKAYRSPGDVQTYSWQQVESTGMIRAKAWSHVVNTPQTVTVTTTRLLPLRPNRPAPQRQIKIQIQPTLRLPAAKSSSRSQDIFTNIP